MSPQALAGDLSDKNREGCAETTKPLIESVEALTTFASSPQFASTPAKISAQARKAQEPLLDVCTYIHNSTECIIDVCLSVCTSRLVVMLLNHPVVSLLLLRVLL